MKHGPHLGSQRKVTHIPVRSCTKLAIDIPIYASGRLIWIDIIGKATDSGSGITFFKIYIRLLYLQTDPIQFVVLSASDFKCKKEEIWLSPMTKAPTPTEMSKGQSDNTNNATKKFDYTAIADRLRTVSLSKYSHPTGVLNLPTNRNRHVIKRTHICKFVNNPPYWDWGRKANQSGEVIKCGTPTYKVI